MLEVSTLKTLSFTHFVGSELSELFPIKRDVVNLTKS